MDIRISNYIQLRSAYLVYYFKDILFVHPLVQHFYNLTRKQTGRKGMVLIS